MSIDRNQVPYLPNVQPQLTHIVERLEYRRLLMMALALAVAALAGWLYLRQASTVAVYTHNIRQLERRKTELRQEIQHLQTQAAGAVSLGSLRRAADQLGYHLPKTGETVARQTIVIDALPAAETLASASEVKAPAADRNPLRRAWQRFQAWLRAEPGT